MEADGILSTRSEYRWNCGDPHCHNPIASSGRSAQMAAMEAGCRGLSCMGPPPLNHSEGQ